VEDAKQGSQIMFHSRLFQWISLGQSKSAQIEIGGASHTSAIFNINRGVAPIMFASSALLKENFELQFPMR
jgi:hypothetical protein